MKYIGILFGLLLLSAPLPAQQNLSLEQVWRLLEDNNYDLKKQADLLEQLQLDYQEQFAGYLPSVSLKAGYNYVSELAQIETPFLPKPIEAGVNNQYDVALNVTQPVFTGFRTGNLRDAAEAQFNAGALQSDAVTNMLRLQSGLLYYQVQDKIMAKKVLAQSILRADTQLNMIRNLLEAKQVTAFDTLEAATRKLQVQNSVAQLEEARLVLLSKLHFLLNRADLPPIEALEIQGFQPPDTPLQNFIDTGMKRRPELESSRYAINAGRARTGALESAWYPQVFAQGAFHYARPGVNFFKDEWMDYYTLGVSLQWNLWNGQADSHRLEKARLEVSKLNSEDQKKRAEIRQQIEEAWYKMQTSRRQIELLRKLEEQESLRYRITNERFESAQSSAVDVQLAETSLTQAQLNLQREYINWFINRLNLYYASGILNDFQGGY